MRIRQVKILRKVAMNDTQESLTPEVKETAPADSGQTNYFAGETTEQVAPESEAGEKVEEGTTSEDTTVDDGSHEDSDDTNVDADKKSGKGFEKRIERFNRRLAEKEQEIEHWRKAALATGGNTQAAAPQVQQPVARPTLEQFGNNFEAYTEALTDWKVNETLQKRDAQHHQEQVTKTFAEKETALKKAHPEYDEVVTDFTNKYKHVNAPEVNQYISENSAELYFYLASNHAETDRILALPPIRRVGELGKLEARLNPAGAGSTKVAPRVSNAPKPATPEKGSAPVVKDVKDPNLSQKEYRELRMANRKRY